MVNKSLALDVLVKSIRMVPSTISDSTLRFAVHMYVQVSNEKIVAHLDFINFINHLFRSAEHVQCDIPVHVELFLGHFWIRYAW